MTQSIVSNHAKYAMAHGELILGSGGDTIKFLLMRNGFVFNKDIHATLLNIKTNSGEVEITFDNTEKTIVRSSGDFETDGFVIGNKITTNSASNPGPFYITGIGGDTIECSAATFVEETDDYTVTSDDELETDNGYTQGSISLAGVTLTEDDSGDKAVLTCDAIEIAASGGDIGPTPGAILYDDTSTDDVILEYLVFDEDHTILEDESSEFKNIKLNVI